MERDFMGLNSNVKEEPADGFEAFNNHQPCEIQTAHFLQLHHDNKQAVPFNTSSPLSTTEPWYSSKAVSVPTQLTIFYGGMVNVYDDISPHKAEAIMLLAGKGAATNGPQPRGQATGDMKKPQPCSTVSSPMYVSSHPVASGYRASTTFVAKMETSRVMSSFTQATQLAVPQARKASLARFLEKRKERVMAASVAYHLNKNSVAVVAGSKQRV